MKTDYLIHESVYQRKKAAGGHSWGGLEIFENTLAGLKKDLPILPAKAKTLEIGCGNGVFSLWLAEQSFQVFGMDIAPSAIGWANELKAERKLEADFRIGSVLDLSCYGQNTFDFVLDAYCLHCIVGADRQTILEQVFNVLKPGGRFLVQTMCNEPEEAQKSAFDPVSRCVIIRGVAGRYFGLREDILAELKSAGFTIEIERLESEENEQDTLIALCRK